MKYGLVGKTLTYSFSKIIHEFLYNEFNIDATYDLIELDCFDKSIIDMYDGVNVTIPYKLDALKEYKSNNLFSCNVVFKNECFNVDIDGFLYLYSQIHHEVNSIVVLGSGAMAKMIADYFNGNVEIIETIDLDVNRKLYGDVLIYANPVGVNEYKCVVSKENISNFKTVLDLNYNPIHPLVKQYCIENNVNYIGGIDMLIVQAIRTFEIFTSLDVDNLYIDKIRNYIYKHLNLGVVIIGMPLAGKSTLCRNYKCVDLDSKIEEEYGEISSIIKVESDFRKIEHNTLKKYIDEPLICLGGGAITYFENYELLRNKLIIFLNTPYDELIKRLKNSSRPLLKSTMDLKKLYDKRINIYKGLCNMELDYESARRFLDGYFSN